MCRHGVQNDKPAQYSQPSQYSQIQKISCAGRMSKMKQGCVQNVCGSLGNSQASLLALRRIAGEVVGDCGFQVVRDLDILGLGITDHFAAIAGAYEVAALTACPFGGFQVGKAVADHERPFQVHFEFGGGVKDHARFRFAASAFAGKFRMVWTVVKSINSCACGNQQFLDSGIDFVHVGFFIISARDAGLVGYDNYQEPVLAQFAQSINYAGNKRDFLRLPEVVNFFIDDTVAIKETGFIHRVITFTNI